MVRILIDADTGGVIAELADGDRVIRRNSIASFKTLCAQPSENQVKLDGCFVKLNESSLKWMAGLKFSNAELKLLLFACEHVAYRNGLIAYGNGKPMRKEGFTRAIGLDVRSVERAISSLTTKGLLCRGRVGEDVLYFLNPYFCYKGQYINATLHEMFKKTRWAGLFYGREANV